GTEVTVRQETDYPWDGHVKLKVTSPHAVRFNWYIRIPAWTKNQAVPSGLYSFKKHLNTKVVIRINGKKINYRETKGYAVIPGKWESGDEIDLELPMQIRRIETNPLVVNNRGKIAVQRGPLVYCLEGIDHHNGFMFDYMIPDHSEIKNRYEKDLLNGVVTLTCKGKKAGKRSACKGHSLLRLEQPGSELYAGMDSPKPGHSHSKTRTHYCLKEQIRSFYWLVVRSE
ncbi:MAG: glycoside hydrolase family 127 protein, partial [Candidatus Aminicenantes bacterium]|nr:glycoside hydrolase family 127 protein [Candidatus Aminicenantes bacterium]